MRKEFLLDFLTSDQILSVKDYNFIETDTNLCCSKIKNGNYVKYMERLNYRFWEGGIVVGFDYPVLKLKAYVRPNRFYTIDVTKFFIFYKRGDRWRTRREYFEEMLESLEKLEYKKSV